MKYLFMAPPATGEMQPALAIAHALQIQDVEAEIFIASGSSFGRRWMPNPAKEPKSGLSRANPTGSNVHADKKSSARLSPGAGVKEVKIHSNSYLPSLEKSASPSESSAFRFTPIDLGTTKDVEDYSHHMLRPSDSSAPSSLSFGSHKHERGNPIPFFDFWEEFAAGTEDERMNTIQKVLTIIDGIRPDMIVVDQIYATPFDAVRYSKLPFILLAPGHPSFAAEVNPLHEPLSMSGIRWQGNLWNIYDNFKLIYKLVTWIIGSNWAHTTLKLRRWTLGFPWLSIGDDCSITPPPGKVDQVCAAIMCNVEHLNFYHNWHPKCHFVGPCFKSSMEATSKVGHAHMDSVKQWLDIAATQKHDVVFISFGSMFPFNEQDYRSMLRALKSVHQSHPSLRILWKVIKCEGVKTEDLSFVRQVDWLPSVKEVYSHPAVKVVVHHGGGSTANEVIYHGLRHLVIPQWSDTYDWAATISAFGLGEQVGNPGPDLDTKEIASKLLRLLQYPNHYKDNIAYWQRRSQESIGSKGAASIIKQAAIDQAAQYKKAFALNKHQFTTPFKANS